MKAFEKYQKVQNEKIQKEKSLLNKAIRGILSLTPGVNLLIAGIKTYQIEHLDLEDEDLKAIIQPMTEEEKKMYKSLKTKTQKIGYAAIVTEKKANEDLIGYVGNKAIIVQQNLVSIPNDQLVPLAYTLEEVKELNEVTGLSYKLGRMDGINTAIIGLPNSDKHFDSVKLKKDNFTKVHDYKLFSEEEAKDKTFIVYPYSKEKEVLAFVEELRKKRHINKTQSSIAENLEFNAKLDELLQKTLLVEEMAASVEKTVILEKTYLSK